MIVFLLYNLLAYMLLASSQLAIHVSQNCTSLSSCTENLTYGLQQIHTGSVLWIHPGSYDLSYVRLHSVNDSVIKSHGEPGSVTINCSQPGNSGLGFEYCHNVSIFGLTFVQCSQIHNSTSRDYYYYPDEFKFINMNVALYFIWSSTITLHSVQVFNSSGIAIQMYGVIGYNIITNCSISNNRAEFLAGGLYIEFPYCDPGDLSCQEEASVVDSTRVSDSYYIIKSNHFEFNQAFNRHSRSPLIIPIGTYHDAFGRGGGVSVYFKGHASSNTVQIETNSFYNNEAVFGGGLFVEFQDYSYNNTINIAKQNHFSNNSANYSGGGLYIGFIDIPVVNGSLIPKNNTINIIDSMFEDNKAKTGGGTAFGTSKEYSTFHTTNSVNFINCSWLENSAQYGAGLDLSLLNFDIVGNIPSVFLSNCSFSNNLVNYNKKVFGQGALYTNSIPLIFNQSVLFSSNSDGSALYISNAKVTFNSFTHAEFDNNVGRDGGAIFIIIPGFLAIKPNTSFNFTNNRANIAGGAIYAKYPNGRNLLTSHNCFIKYSECDDHKNEIIHSKNWKTKFYFSNNTRGDNKNNSIYATTVIPCLQNLAYSHKSIINASRKVFCEDHIWNYADSNNCSEEVLTDAASLRAVNESLKIFPGINTSLNIVAKDDQNVDVTKFLILNAFPLTTGISVDKYQYITSDSIVLKQENTNILNGSLMLQSAPPNILIIKLNVTFVECPPGLSLQNGSCTCNYGTFGQIIQCENSFSATIQRGYWIGKDNNNDVVVGQCRFCNYHEKGTNIKLPKTFDGVQEKFCGSVNRSGILCSHCKNGYAPAVNSFDYVCVPCSETQGKYNWIFYLMLKLFLPLLIFLFIYYTKISVTSGLLNGAIFYGQILSTVVPLDGHDLIPIKDILGETAEVLLEKIYINTYNLWNMDAFDSLFPPFCLHPSTTKLTLLFILYGLSFIPLFLVLIALLIYFLEHRRRICTVCTKSRFAGLFDHRKIMNALVAFVVLSYTNVAVTTAYICGPLQLYNINNSVQDIVLEFDGNIQFTSIEAQKVLITLVSICFILVLPLLLILFRHDDPTFGGFKSHILFHFQSPFKDAHVTYNDMEEIDINCRQGCFNYQDKLKYRFKLNKKEKNLNCKISCYHGFCACLCNWNIHDFRWMAGAYLYLRLLYIVIYILSSHIMMQYLLQLILSIVIAMFFTLFQPYKNSLHNLIDFCFFLLMAIIISFSMYQLYLTGIGIDPSLCVYVIQYILVFVPAFWMAGVIVSDLHRQGLFRKIKQQLAKCNCFKKAQAELNEAIEETNLVEKQI